MVQVTMTDTTSLITGVDFVCVPAQDFDALQQRASGGSPAMRFGRAAGYCDQVFRKFVAVNPVRRRNVDEK